MAPSYKGGGGATNLGNRRAIVGAAHGRENDGSGRSASTASTAFGGMAPSYKGGGGATGAYERGCETPDGVLT